MAHMPRAIHPYNLHALFKWMEEYIQSPLRNGVPHHNYLSPLTILCLCWCSLFIYHVPMMWTNFIWTISCRKSVYIYTTMSHAGRVCCRHRSYRDDARIRMGSTSQCEKHDERIFFCSRKLLDNFRESIQPFLGRCFQQTHLNRSWWMWPGDWTKFKVHDWT